MKKLIILFAIVLFAMPSHAQLKKVKGNGNVTNTTRTVSDYDKIGISGSFDVKLVAGAEGKITIEAEDNLLEYLITEVDGDHLKIKWEKGINVRTTKKILITIPFKDIEEVALAGSGDVISNDIIEADNFKAALSGAGDFTLKLKVNSLKSAISGSGDMNLSGSATNFDCAISGSGDVDANDLVTDNASVRIAGSGDVSVHVKEELDAKVSGSGNVSYKGNPKTNSKVSGSGSIRSN
ncbi:head GIN domain-containing protein [Aureibaculum sp. 2210JD6-5]|uniref:head GIN domain-containing protein n=1 Tax=Aureibaculum sp. 2210JD6-5 TaxID=3103957 RepID=UPI002AAD527C|nr:head GIN domain-containing protein [Aureibaculum sp. 2210JD6-5]MDY7395596.1 head GIN domain-containing protein [Aureibaculum sp. 2210JD6-5]